MAGTGYPPENLPPLTGDQQAVPSVDPVYPPSTQPGYPPEYPPGQTQPPYPLQPPQSSNYPSQQGVYPPGYEPIGHPPDYQPQQEGYPPSYPPQPQSFGYPSNQPYYPDSKDAPPPYYSKQVPPPQQQTTTGVVVVQQQPTFTTIRSVPVGDHYRTFSIIVCILCCLFGSPFTLCCTLPAIFTALQARDAERLGDHAYAADKDRVTITLNVVAIIFGFVILVLNIIRYTVSL